MRSSMCWAACRLLSGWISQRPSSPDPRASAGLAQSNAGSCSHSWSAPCSSGCSHSMPRAPCGRPLVSHRKTAPQPPHRMCRIALRQLSPQSCSPAGHSLRLWPVGTIALPKSPHAALRFPRRRCPGGRPTRIRQSCHNKSIGPLPRCRQRATRRSLTVRPLRADHLVSQKHSPPGRHHSHARPESLATRTQPPLLPLLRIWLRGPSSSNSPQGQETRFVGCQYSRVDQKPPHRVQSSLDAPKRGPDWPSWTLPSRASSDELSWRFRS
mmetsp:Transcript_22809/g.73106  ORF Transcript_22809/g.73106 Transcript_22809/m.73106 type:complete len:268 (-) Transcript_22809:590-1393(-)